MRRKAEGDRRDVSLPGYAEKWRPKDIVSVTFDPIQQQKYVNNDPTCIYRRWPLKGQGGRADKSHGEFSLIVAREHFRKRGLTVLASEPGLKKDAGFILLSYPGYRERTHPAYMRMVEIFGSDTLEQLNAVTDAVKTYYTRSRGGGDPDLFVFEGDGKKERSFVEAKNTDELTPKQRICFPLIEKFLNCEVKLAQLVPVEGPNHPR